MSADVNRHGVTAIGRFEHVMWTDGYSDPVWSLDRAKILAGREYLDKNGVFRSGLRPRASRAAHAARRACLGVIHDLDITGPIDTRDSSGPNALPPGHREA